MAITVLEIGPVGAPFFTFEDTDNSLFSAEYTAGVDIIGIRLTVDTSTCIVNYPFGPDSAEVIAGPDFSSIVSSDGYVMCTNKEFYDLRKLPYGTEARLYRRGKLFMKLYKDNTASRKITPTKYSISLISAIGLFENQKHLGGFYNGVRFDSVLQEIIGDVVPYTVEEDVASLLVRGGYLPHQSKRDSLHNLCFAYGVMIGRNEAGNMNFQFIKNTEVIQVPEGDFYEGGDIGDPDGVTAVDVTEHSFMMLPTDETVVVYDNTDGSETAQDTFIDFKDNAPLHDLVTTGSLAIQSSGVNWAIISGTGVLSGKKYTHSTRVLTRIVEDTAQTQGKVADLTDNTMVTVLNSENVAARLLAYYANKSVVKASMVIKDQQLGDLLSGISPFGDELTGFLSSVHGIISTKIKGTCELIANYTPTGQGSNFTHFVVLTGSGNWPIPPEVFQKESPTIEAVLIEGGHGGFPGQDGTQGKPGSVFTGYGEPGVGGEGGLPGLAGKALTVKIDCTNMTSIPYNCGARGKSGSPGGATTFGEYSSDDGAIPPYGIVNIFTGEVYATSGDEAGIAGGDGSGNKGEGTIVTYQGRTWNPGKKGARYIGSSGSFSEGGYGGGAAVGSNGGDGVDGKVSSGYAGGSTGGNGADGTDGASTTIIGKGGSGGHGGGGAGLGGSQKDRDSISKDVEYAGNGNIGKGGLGGIGGPGGIIVYF